MSALAGVANEISQLVGVLQRVEGKTLQGLEKRVSLIGSLLSSCHKADKLLSVSENAGGTTGPGISDSSAVPPIGVMAPYSSDDPAAVAIQPASSAVMVPYSVPVTGDVALRTIPAGELNYYSGIGDQSHLPESPILQRPLVPGFTVKFLQEEKLMKPVPETSVCQGCHISLSVLNRFIMNWCVRCKASNVRLLVATMEVIIQPEDTIESLSALSPNELFTRLNIKHAIPLVGAIRNAFLQSRATKQPVVRIIRSIYWVKNPVLNPGNTAHANALFVYINPFDSKVQIRLFDPHFEQRNAAYDARFDESSNDARKMSELGKGATALIFSKFLPEYFKRVLTGLTEVDLDLGQSCPVGLQSNEFNDPARQRKHKRLISELVEAQGELDRLKEKKDLASDQYMLASTNAEVNAVRKAISAISEELQKKDQEVKNKLQEIENLEVEVAAARAERLQKRAACHKYPGGFCEAWTSIVTLLQIAFPDASVNEIAVDLFKHYKDIEGVHYLQDLISRFSYNVFLQIGYGDDVCCWDEHDQPLGAKAQCGK